MSHGTDQGAGRFPPSTALPLEHCGWIQRILCLDDLRIPVHRICPAVCSANTCPRAFGTASQRHNVPEALHLEVTTTRSDSVFFSASPPVMADSHVVPFIFCAPSKRHSSFLLSSEEWTEVDDAVDWPMQEQSDKEWFVFDDVVHTLWAVSIK